MLFVHLVNDTGLPVTDSQLFLGPHESAPKRHLDLFIRFAGFTGVPNSQTRRPPNA